MTKGNAGKGLIGLLVSGIGLAVLIFVFPFLACLYRNHQFEALVRLKIDSPDCWKTIPGRSPECCQCLLAFDGIRSSDGIQFVGTDLKYSYDSEHRIFLVEGEGKIKNGGNSIEIHSGHVYINGQQLPVRSTPLRASVRGDGHLLNQFCDVAW